MSEELLPYYNRELAFIRRLGSVFAETYPKIAERLKLGPDAAEDPHVERLIEGFAYLNARLRYKLDDDFPELTDALLHVLYPHYLAPVPSMAIVQFSLDRSQGELTTGYEIPRESAIDTDPIEGQPCRFQTSYPVTLWPVELAAAELQGVPFTAPQTRFSSRASAVLRLSLRCHGAEMTFAQLPIGALRFHLRGQDQHIYPLYELLLNSVLGIALGRGPADREPVLLDGGHIRPVGFERDEGLLPYSPRSLLGYRLLTEFFAFPQKFLFFDLATFEPRNLAGFGKELDVFIYLGGATTDLEQNVGRDTFQLGCTPMVNLFRQRAEPIALTQTETEYRVVPDARRPRAFEVYSVDRVTATSPAGERIEFEPFYAVRHALARANKAFWTLSRRTAQRAGGEIDRGMEAWLTLVDLGFRPHAPANWALDVETTCLNRDLPHRLPFGRGQLPLRAAKGGPVRIECLTRPTPTLRPPLKHGAMWRILSHLSLNHMSLVDNESGPHPLREILKLYDFADSSQTQAIIEGVRDVTSRRVNGRVGRGSQGGFCRGIEVRVDFDEDKFSGSGVFLFASVLERFLALYCSINSFSRMVATTNQREGELRRWPPRAGEQTLL